MRLEFSEEKMDQSQKETFGDMWSRWGINKLILGALVGGFFVPFTPVADWQYGAETAAKEAVSAAVLDALTPICVARAANDPQFNVRVAELQESATSTYTLTTNVTDYGWAKLPGMGDTVDRRLAEACAKGVLAAIKTEPA